MGVLIQLSKPIEAGALAKEGSQVGSDGFQSLGAWAIFYMRGPACERREQLGVWGRCLGGGGAEFF